MSVHNKNREQMLPGDVYVGRGSVWGNPFSGSGKVSTYDVIRVGSVAESIIRYEEYIIDRLYREPQLREQLKALRGKRLFCYCKPGPCHGDVLELLAETI